MPELVVQVCFVQHVVLAALCALSRLFGARPKHTSVMK